MSSLLELTDCAVDLQCGEVCLHDVAQYTCTIDGVLLSWGLPDITILQVLIQQPNATDSTNTFTAMLTNHSNNQLTSTLSFMTTIQLNNEDIMCISGDTASCNIIISGISIVNGNTISNKNTSNSSTTLVINQLILGMNYSFSVTGVDKAERTGEESETARIIMDGECIDYWLCDIYILG